MSTWYTNFIKNSGGIKLSKWYKNFIKELSEVGFECAYIRSFELTSKKIEYEAIFYCPKSGIIVYGESICKSGINKITLFANISSETAISCESNLLHKVMLEEYIVNLLKDSTSILVELNLTQKSKSEVLSSIIRKLKDEFKFNYIWENNSILNFCNSIEEISKINPRIITNKKILESSPELKKIVGFPIK